MEDTKRSFEKWVAGQSDEELVLMITDHKKYYKPEMLEIAVKEFEKRNIPECRIQVISTNVDDGGVIYFPRAEEPLDGHVKFLAFLLPGLLMLVLSEKYCSAGYRRKYKELTKFTICGFCFYMSFLILGNLLKVFVV